MNKIKIHNAETGEVIVRDMNAEELAQLAEDQANAEKEQQAYEEAQAKREAALAKLVALGLTADDLTALGLGGN